MKKAFKKLCCVVLVLSLLTFCGCSKNAENDKENTESLITLKSAFQRNEIDLDANHIEISIISDETVRFTNRNADFYKEFISFLENTKLSSKKIPKPDAERFYISIREDRNIFPFHIYKNDVVKIHITSIESRSYYCKGIYKKFIKTFDKFFSESKKYCRVAQTPIAGMNEYRISSKDDVTLEYDCISRNPYIFYNSGIVHLWVQSGTGTLTRSAKFFDVEKGLISPEYYGQTDYFGELVISTSSSQIFIFKMFSGEELYCFDQFEEPLGDCTENIQSAYFTEDGTKIMVKYFNADFETRTQIFTIPQSITD